MKWIYEQLVWIGISFSISLGIALLFPLYIALPLIISIFLGISYFRRRQLRNRFAMSGSQEKAGSVKYHCISCGSVVSGKSCLNCGSKMKKADF